MMGPESSREEPLAACIDDIRDNPDAMCQCCDDFAVVTLWINGHTTYAHNLCMKALSDLAYSINQLYPGIKEDFEAAS